MLMLQCVTVIWVLYTVSWETLSRQKIITIVHWLLTLKSADLTMFMLQSVTIVWVLYTVSWETLSRQKITTIVQWLLY